MGGEEEHSPTKERTRMTTQRTESDAIGSKKIPRDAYTGIFYARAKENFSISTYRMPRAFYQNIALLKKIAAREHTHAGRLEPKVGRAIESAAQELYKGKLLEHIDLDVFQAGAGTPMNMAVNEIIANRALEKLHERKGKYALIHPNTHVNMMQSTNDVIPTALRLTLVNYHEALEKQLVQTIHATETLSKKYSKTLKTGRTHLQTAVPVTFGQELYTYAQSLRDALAKLRLACHALYELPIGGTATGTGITTEPGYDVKIVSRIKKETRHPFFPSHRKMFHTSHVSVFTHYANALDELAEELQIWTNDWVVLGSDPASGIGEIRLPEAEPGSSIMPGKVNPSILEALKMICLHVHGSTETIHACAESTQL
ncbi:MAG: lyase family protein [archaeon]